MFENNFGMDERFIGCDATSQEPVRSDTINVITIVLDIYIFAA